MVIFATDRAWAKPLSLQPDKELVASAWAAEVTILGVAAPFSDTDPALVRVRVTGRRDRLYRGRQHAGRELLVFPPTGGEESALKDLEQLIEPQSSVLMVVGPTGHIRFVGEPRQAGNKRLYRLRTWYDFNAWWMFSLDRTFGRVVTLPGNSMPTLEVSAATIRERLARP